MSANRRIKFRCTSCRKPLSIGRKKIGALVKCPQCEAEITVPAEDDLDEGHQPDHSRTGSSTDDESGHATQSRTQPENSASNLSPFQEFEVFDDDYDEPELIYLEGSESGEPSSGSLNERLSVPRRMIYLQGALLGFVAVMFFLLGLIVGSTGSAGKSGSSGATIVRGTVKLQNQMADEGAVIFLLPSKSRPSSRFEAEELRPGRVFTSSNPEVPLIRGFGGNVCTANRAGQFEMKVKPNREYILLVVSANASRNQELNTEFHTDVGHYFTSLDKLTEGKACLYRRVLPLGSSENFGEIVVESDG